MMPHSHRDGYLYPYPAQQTGYGVRPVTYGYQRGQPVPFGPHTSTYPPAPPPPPPPPLASPARDTKRKVTPDEQPSGLPVAIDTKSGPAPKEDKSKRIKTPRACDSCRRKKIRCDAVEGIEPPICIHCKQHGLECTWFLPITETRFKRKREQEDAQSLASNSHPPSSRGPSYHSNLPTSAPPNSRSAPFSPSPRSSLSYVSAPNAPHMAIGNEASPSSSEHSKGDGSGRRHDARVLGPTSIAYMMHSTASFPVGHMQRLDVKYFHKLEARESGDGMIKVSIEDPVDGGLSTQDDHANVQPMKVPPLQDGSCGLVIPASVAEQLVNYFFTHLVELYPVMSRDNFLSLGPLSPLLFYSICGVASLHCSFDPSYRKALRDVMIEIFRSNELLPQGDLTTIQGLLLYTCTMDLERTRQAGSTSWTGLGAAIRMGQCLGLHRETASNVQRGYDYAELRRRVWGGCIIADRWMAAMFGLPHMIDLADCDRLFPSEHDVRPGRDVNLDHQPYLGNTNMIELSILLGRVLKLLYTPTGILQVTDEEAYSLLNDIDAWERNLSPDCQYKDGSGSVAGGYVQMCSVAVRFLFYRPFMRISYSCPENLTFAFTVKQYDHMSAMARQAIAFCNEHDEVIQSFSAGVYSLFICCLIEYHGYVRRNDAEALRMLTMAKDVFSRIATPDCTTRLRVGEIVNLLYSTAISASKWTEVQKGEGLGVDPTAGAKRKAQDPLLRWKSGSHPADLGHFETDDERHQVPGLVLKSDSGTPLTRGGDTPYRSPEEIKPCLTPSVTLPPPLSPSTGAGPSNGPSKGPSKGRVVAPPFAPSQPLPQTAPAAPPFVTETSINLNPALNQEFGTLNSVSGEVDFLGSGTAMRPVLPQELLDWTHTFPDWGFVVPGLDSDFLRGMGGPQG